MYLAERSSCMLAERLFTANESACIMSGTEFTELGESRNIVPTPTAIVRTAMQKQVDGYRFELPHSGDMEMWLRLASKASLACSKHRRPCTDE